MKQKIRGYIIRLAKKMFKCGVILYPIIKFFVSKKINLTLNEAEKIMSEHSADPKTSPLCKNNISAPTADLTIIIPAYNAEKYIEECVGSVICQKTKYSFEVMVVNDGSTDRTAEKLDKYTNVKNLTIITQENQGFSGARNTGLKNIHSKFIMFVDSDDILLDGAVESLLDAAYESNADIVQGGIQYVENIGKKVISKITFPANKECPASALLGFSFAKIYKSGLFENICFPEKYWFEDIIISHLVFPFSKRNCTIKNIVYSYRKNPEGISASSKGKPKSIDTFWVTACTLRARKELSLETDNIYYTKLLGQIKLNYKRTSHETEAVKKAMFVMTNDLLKKSTHNNIHPLKKSYSYLENAILQNDYGRYSFLCKILY